MEILGIKVLGPREGRVGSEPRMGVREQHWSYAHAVWGTGGAGYPKLNSSSFFPLQMAATIDMNFQSDLLSIFEENLF